MADAAGDRVDRDDDDERHQGDREGCRQSFVGGVEGGAFHAPWPGPQNPHRSEHQADERRDQRVVVVLECPVQCLREQGETDRCSQEERPETREVAAATMVVLLKSNLYLLNWLDLKTTTGNLFLCCLPQLVDGRHGLQVKGINFLR